MFINQSIYNIKINALNCSFVTLHMPSNYNGMLFIITLSNEYDKQLSCNGVHCHNLF